MFIRLISLKEPKTNPQSSKPTDLRKDMLLFSIMLERASQVSNTTQVFLLYLTYCEMQHFLKNQLKNYQMESAR